MAAGLLLTDGFLGLRGWQWLFLMVRAGYSLSYHLAHFFLRPLRALMSFMTKGVLGAVARFLFPLPG